MSPPVTSSAGAARTPPGPRLLLIDADAAPRHALAGQLSSHLRAALVTPDGHGDGGAVLAAGPVTITESASVTDALADRAITAWDVAVLGAPDAQAARAAITALRGAGLKLPIVAMVPPSPGGADAAPWPWGVTHTTRPARLATLVALLRAALEPDGTGRADGFDLGPYRCAPETRTLTDRLDGRVLALTEKEAAILASLRAAGGPVTRDTLLAEVWGYGESIDTHTLETHIHSLRRKIEPDPRHPTLLITDCGGYRMGG